MNATATKTRIALKNLVYATDFSPASEAALPYAVGLAKQFGAKVHGVHIMLPSVYPIVGPEDIPIVLETAKEMAEADAQELHEKFAEVPHEVTVCEGEVWPAIEEIAEEQNADMIVVGTRGRTGIARALLGSVAEEIVRSSAFPVLTVGPRVSQSTPLRLEMKEILFATDFSPESLAALPYAVSMAQAHMARLTLLHVVAEAKAGELVHAEQYANAIRHELQNLIPGCAEAWSEPKCVVVQGAEAQKILEVATAVGADLIVLGVRGAQGAMGAAVHVVPSVVHGVVTQAECPVLTVRG